MFVTALVSSTFFLDYENETLYYMYSMVSLMLYLTIEFTKKIFRKEKQSFEFLEKTKSYHLLAAIIFLFSFVFMKISEITGANLKGIIFVGIVIGSFVFSLSFLKIMLFTIRGIKK